MSRSLDHAKERQEKPLGEEFVGEILLEKFDQNVIKTNHKCNKLVTINALVWLTINVTNFSHK